VKRFLLLSAVAVCVLYAEDELAKALEETTEIATKTRVNADYVPGTVSIIKGEELKAFGIMSLAQPNALDMIVGMESSVNALRGSGAVYGGQGVKIKWLINGRAVSSQIASGSIWGRTTMALPILVDQIDRIEIIRGPDSAVYGENAIFGVINIVTKSESSSIALSASYQGENKSGAYATANTAYKKDDFSITASVSVYGNDGYPMYVGKSGNFYSWVNASQAPGYGPGYLPNGSAGYSLFLDAAYGENRVWVNRLNKRFAQGGLGTWYPTDPLPQDTNKLDGTEVYEQFGYGRSFNIGGIDADFKVGYDTSEQSIDNFLRLGKDFQNSGFDAVRSFKYKEVRKYISLDADKKYDEHHLLIGLFGQKTVNVEDKRYGNYDFDWSIPTAVQQPLSYAGSLTTAEDTKRWQRAVFFQDTWDVTDKATITYGARYDNFSGNISSSGWSPRVALVYRLDEHNILKAQYARAFRPPTYSEIDSCASAEEMKNLKSETVDTVELGHIYKNGNISLKNTLFESRIHNMISFDDWTYNTVNLPNVGIIQGFEMEGRYSADDYEIGFNQAFYKTHKDERSFYSPDNGCTYVYKAGTLPLAPAYMANVFVKLNQNTSYPTTFWYHYVGAKKRKSEFITNSIYDNPKGGGNGETAPQDYLNVTQQFKNIAKNLDLSMGIQNVFGKTIKTLYMPLNQPNNQDIPYMRQSFWINLNYKF